MAAPLTPTTGASISDIMTVLQHLVQATNNYTQAFLNVNGASTTEGIVAPTVVKATPGRLAKISVIVAGSAPGVAYDSSILGVTTAPLCGIPNTLGVFTIGMPTDTGLLIVPGTGQTLSVSWS
jgi:hypothetical protein